MYIRMLLLVFLEIERIRIACFVFRIEHILKGNWAKIKSDIGILLELKRCACIKFPLDISRKALVIPHTGPSIAKILCAKDKSDRLHLEKV